MTDATNTTTPSVGAALTWATSSFVWGSETATFREWRLAYDTISHNLDVESGVTFGDSEEKQIGVNLDEALQYDESIEKGFGKNAFEEAGLSENLSNTVAFVRQFAQLVMVRESSGRGLSRTLKEVIGLKDIYRRNAQAVISDLTIRNVDVTDEDFNKMITQAAAPIGYSDFELFTPGDIEYQKALFKAVFQTTKGAPGVRVSSMKLAVDVPDIIESGTGTAEGAVTRVNFKRKFNIPPEVTLTLKGGSAVVSAPKIVDIQKDYFLFQLIDPAGALASGTISYNAHGY